MIDGRVVANGRDVGTGFCVADRLVLTAGHVVRDHAAADLAFVLRSGVHVRVDQVEFDPGIDVAVLRVARSLAIVPSLAETVEDSPWRVHARPRGNDPQLSGIVTATDHRIQNRGGFEMMVLQLRVHEQVQDFSGYSGSAVTVDGAVVGMLVEQLPARLRSGGHAPATNVLYAVPVRQIVRRLRLPVPILPARAGLPEVQALLDTRFFDLDPLKSAIFEAHAEATSRMLGFGLAHPETVVVRKLCEWLPSYLGETECKEWLGLNPLVISAQAAARCVERYMSDLSRVNVLCPILADGVPDDVLEDFWQRVAAAQIATSHRWLVLMFAAGPGTRFPRGVVELPLPRFERAEIAAWAHDVAAYRRWPASLAEVWADLLAERAADGEGLSIRFTYEAIQDSIRQLRQQPELLERLLEERLPA